MVAAEAEAVSTTSRSAIALALLWLTLIVGGAELLARNSHVNRILAAPTIGSSNRTLEIKIHFLDRFATQHGSVDCVVLGSSIVNRGFDPDAFAAAYRAKTGEEINCFNIGIGNLNSQRAYVLADVIARRYQPQLLIYGTGPREMAVAETNQDLWLMGNDWVAYQRGEPNGRGWLLENSFAVKYLLYPGMWYFNAEHLLTGGAELRDYHANGFHPDASVLTPDQIPNRADPSAVDEKVMAIYEDYRIAASNRDSIGDLVGLANDSMTVVVVEMPLHHAHYELFERQVASYQSDYLQPLAAMTASFDGIFWQTSSALELTDTQLWKDSYHLNEAGAQQFSRWLGEQTADQVELQISNHEP